MFGESTHRDQLVKAFLDRHGFSDVNSPRDLDDSVPRCIRMKPVYPLEVAADLGKEAMVNMLLDAGAISNPRGKPSSKSYSKSSSKASHGSLFQSFASWCGISGSISGQKQTQDASPQPQISQPLRSCLSADKGSSRPRLISCCPSEDMGREFLRSEWL